MQTLSGSQVRTLTPVLSTPRCPSLLCPDGGSLSRLDSHLRGSCVCHLSFPLQGQAHQALFTVISQSLQLCLAQSRCHMIIC